ncbi:sulfite exporter TauE/SafE [Paucibacter oligotrophus]|uniref:Sulfite exporter TauE/SafE n=1 Tax=Roseateles oligotrophus TaxID=1769250 RepID=A0A840L5C3_9BURK|nr:sulfite exporter TauE/SafE family protein [Roseateles oligotrophus]MBB4841882.1 sulfite exporter TauE/SafE [Roseateles oligotrophus]
MLDVALAGSALMMGLAGIPHCLAMCGASCTAAGGRSPYAFQLGRLLGYGLAGAVAAGSMQLLNQLGQSTALLRPLWVLVQVAAFLLGMALLLRGRQPAWLERLGQDVARQVEVPVGGLRRGGLSLAGTKRVAGAGLAGMAWVAWPCGLLHSALLLAALASGPVQGGLVMAAFALSSGAGLALGPWLLSRLRRRGSDGAGAVRLSVRLGGLGLALGSGWALGHGVWAQVAAVCGQWT